jgi:hypothetical protein
MIKRLLILIAFSHSEGPGLHAPPYAFDGDGKTIVTGSKKYVAETATALGVRIVERPRPGQLDCDDHVQPVSSNAIDQD